MNIGSTKSSYIVSIETGWRPRRVDAELDPGGRGNSLVGKRLGKMRARLVRGSILQNKSLKTKFVKS